MDETEEIIETISQTDSFDETEDSVPVEPEKFDFKKILKLCRKKVSAYIRDKKEKKFTNILYVTLDCPFYVQNSRFIGDPVDFAKKIRQQYPTDDIRVLVPILGITNGAKAPRKLTLEADGNFLELEKTSVHSEMFVQNKTEEVTLYKFTKDNEYIQVYGLYSQAFSFLQTPEELELFENLAVFLKAVRAIIKNLGKENFMPDIVHADRVPFFMGCEFESRIPMGIKVLQTIEEFIKPSLNPQGLFWAAINLADKSAMSKICRDIFVQKCVSRLFNLSAKNFAPKMRECLDLIYKNYNNYIEYSKAEGDGKGDFIFKHLDSRILKLFPNFVKKEEESYYPMLSSIKRSDYIAVISKTYYKNLFEDKIVPEIIIKQLIKDMDKTGYVSLGWEDSKQEGYTVDNFKELKIKDKKALLKEFSQDNVKTNFINPGLFNHKEVKIYGHLDSFYEAPLLFANPTTDLFGEGVDILFSSILKLFELNKNIQIIVAVEDGLKNDFIRNWVNFLSENKAFNGRWVFIDGKLNFPKFFAGTDMFLINKRINSLTLRHLEGMKYGCVPIAAKTGFLNDSVTDIFDDISSGNGYKTRRSLLTENDKSDVYYNTLLKALEIYKNNPSSWNIIVKNCIETDFAWDFKKLEQYDKIYQEIL